MPKVQRLLEDERTDPNRLFLPHYNYTTGQKSELTPLGQLLTASTPSAWSTKQTYTINRATRGVVQPLLQLLLHDARLDINKPAASGGESALMLAVLWTPWAVPLLLRHEKVDVHCKDDKGRAALDLLLHKQASESPLSGDLFDELEAQLTAAQATCSSHRQAHVTGEKSLLVHRVTPPPLTDEKTYSSVRRRALKISS